MVILLKHLFCERSPVIIKASTITRATDILVSMTVGKWHSGKFASTYHKTVRAISMKSKIDVTCWEKTPFLREEIKKTESIRYSCFGRWYASQNGKPDGSTSVPIRFPGTKSTGKKAFRRLWKSPSWTSWPSAWTERALRHATLCIWIGKSSCARWTRWPVVKPSITWLQTGLRMFDHSTIKS